MCQEEGIRVSLAKKAKQNLLGLSLNISTSGPSSVQPFQPKSKDSPLSQQELEYFAKLTPIYLEKNTGWTKQLTEVPPIDDIIVKDYLLGTSTIGEKFKRCYKLSRPYQLVNFVHSLHFNSLPQSPTFCAVRGQCLGSQSSSQDDVKAMYCILDCITGEPYGGYCTCTAGWVFMEECYE